jgi:hypothetical protein
MMISAVNKKLITFFISVSFIGLKLKDYRPNEIPKTNCFGVGHAPESIPMFIPAPAISGSSPEYLVIVNRLEPWK